MTAGKAPDKAARRLLSDSEKAQIRRRRCSGEKIAALAEEFGCSISTVYGVVSPRRDKDGTGVLRGMRERATTDERAARLGEVPPDTRDLTQVLLGDPVFERSALYRKAKTQIERT